MRVFGGWGLETSERIRRCLRLFRTLITLGIYGFACCKGLVRSFFWVKGDFLLMARFGMLFWEKK